MQTTEKIPGNSLFLKLAFCFVLFVVMSIVSTLVYFSPTTTYFVPEHTQTKEQLQKQQTDQLMLTTIIIST